MKKVISIIVFVLIACMVAPAALAAYPAHDSYIYDEIGVLSDEAKSEIKNENDVLFVDKDREHGIRDGFAVSLVHDLKHAFAEFAYPVSNGETHLLGSAFALFAQDDHIVPGFNYSRHCFRLLRGNV